MKYHDKGIYIGEEFSNEYGNEIEIGNDDENGVYSIRFIESGAEFNNVFEEEINFK